METDGDDTFQIVHSSNKLQRDRSVKIHVRITFYGVNKCEVFKQLKSFRAKKDKDVNLL